MCGSSHDIGCADIVFGLDVMAKLDELVENADCLLGIYALGRGSLLAARTDKAGNFDRRLSARATTHEILRSSGRFE